MNVNKESVNTYYQPLKPGELNLVELVAIHIKEGAGIDASNIFISDSNIASVFKLNQVSQRVVINRYLSNRMLIFRALSNVNINNVLPFLANDGLTEDWITVISEFVVPFFKEHKVLQVVHGFENSPKK